jgi:hypothetical protein
LLLLVSWLTYSSTLKMEAICSSEKSSSLLITWCYNPNDCNLQSYFNCGRHRKM